MVPDETPVIGSPPSIELVKLERTLLGDRIVDILREQIISGRLHPGTPLIERELAEHLGVSRVPVRDALMQLEAEGLVVAKSNGRCVIQLTERDILELYQVRLTLEKLAVRLAAQNASSEYCHAMQRALEAMRVAVNSGDSDMYRKSDLEIHRLLWQQAGNAHLVRILNSMVGPIFMFVARSSAYYDWAETLHLHQDLVGCLIAGDAAAAEASMERHMDQSRQRSLMLCARGLL